MTKKLPQPTQKVQQNSQKCQCPLQVSKHFKASQKHLGALYLKGIKWAQKSLKQSKVL